MRLFLKRQCDRTLVRPPGAPPGPRRLARGLQARAATGRAVVVMQAALFGDAFLVMRLGVMWGLCGGLNPGQFCLDTIELLVLKAGFERLRLIYMK